MFSKNLLSTTKYQVVAIKIGVYYLKTGLIFAFDIAYCIKIRVIKLFLTVMTFSFKPHSYK